MKQSAIFIFTALVCSFWYPACKSQSVALTGELRTWHRVTLTFAGPASSEQAAVNPFTDYRLNVTFRKGNSVYRVPGFYAADGDAGQSHADSGNKWRVHFAPDDAGEWSWTASFRQGSMVAISLDSAAGQSAAFDGVSGTFTVNPTDKTGRDNRAKGRLRYTGERYLRHTGTNEAFLKAGADAPEVFLAYVDFDSTYQHGGGNNYLKDWNPHVIDWQPGDPTWDGTKGKGIIGAINYLAAQQMNVFSFLTMNVNGDGKNVWPWVDHNERFRFDVSKLGQWEIVFDHADKKGMFLHFKTQETENDQLLDGGDLGPQRQMYYRELVARFGHHLALNWNLGEETSQSTEQIRDCAAYLAALDPYDHLLVIHTFPGQHDQVYTPLLGNLSALTGASIQTDWDDVHDQTLEWIERSAAAGKQWVVANDEQGHFSVGVSPDAGWPGFSNADNHDDIRKGTLWGNLMAGGAGVEYYFGYTNPESDLTCNDWRSRAAMWAYSANALRFFAAYTDVTTLENDDDRLSASAAYCLSEDGNQHVIYLREGGTTDIDLGSGASSYDVYWYDPRNGGPLVRGSVLAVNGPGWQGIGMPPADVSEDWVALLSAGPLNVLDHLSAEDLAFEVYPNPGQADFRFEWPVSTVTEGELSLYDASGKRVYRSSIRGMMPQVTVPDLAGGTYNVLLQVEHQWFHSRWIKQR
ncbi:MAG: DUF5060 domain-containing protein [Bacteroidota bacterium]